MCDRYCRGVTWDTARFRPGGTSDNASISVVLATYNGARFLPEQLSSLAGQTRPPDELIIVDDGSSDGTQMLIKDFVQWAPFDVRVIERREHLGTWETFEDALRAANGEIIAICDQDDRWHPEKLAVIVARLVREPDALLAFSDARLINATGSLIGRSRWRVAGFAPKHSRLASVDPFATLLSRQAVSGCTTAIRRQLLDAVLPFPENLHPGLPTMMYDRWISLVAAAAAPVVTVPERLVDYRIHPGQQVGIPALRVRRLAPRTALHFAQLVHSQQEKQRRCDYHLAHLELIDKRLSIAGLDSGQMADRLDAAARHLIVRTRLTHGRRTRAREVAAEFRRPDGYRRFSLGVASALGDVTR